MKPTVKRAVTSMLRAALDVTRTTRIGQFLHNQILTTAMERVACVSHGGLELKFAAPNALCEFRVKTFSTKEPETLEWINSIPETSVLWDIGANIGLYSVYAAKHRGCRVWAFEPSVFNLESLARNIFLNGLTDLICIVPLALSDGLGAGRLRMIHTGWGGTVDLRSELRL